MTSAEVVINCPAKIALLFSLKKKCLGSSFVQRKLEQVVKEGSCGRNRNCGRGSVLDKKRGFFDGVPVG